MRLDNTVQYYILSRSTNVSMCVLIASSRVYDAYLHCERLLARSLLCELIDSLCHEDFHVSSAIHHPRILHRLGKCTIHTNTTTQAKMFRVVGREVSATLSRRTKHKLFSFLAVTHFVGVHVALRRDVRCAATEEYPFLSYLRQDAESIVKRPLGLIQKVRARSTEHNCARLELCVQKKENVRIRTYIYIMR